MKEIFQEERIFRIKKTQIATRGNAITLDIPNISIVPFHGGGFTDTAMMEGYDAVMGAVEKEQNAKEQNRLKNLSKNR